MIASEAAPLWFVAWGVFAVVAWLALAVLVARDVKQRGGPAAWTFVLAFVFWPAALYLWARQRGRSGASW